MVNAIKKQSTKNITRAHLSSTFFYFYKILTTFNKFKIMSEVARDNWKRLKLHFFVFTDFINKNLIEEPAVLNVSTERLITMDGGSWLQSDIVWGKNNSCLWSLLSVTRGDNERSIKDFCCLLYQNSFNRKIAEIKLNNRKNQPCSIWLR